jgi:hypothetical protein
VTIIDSDSDSDPDPVPIATQKNRPRLDETRAVWAEEGFRHVCSAIFQERKTNTCIGKLAVRGIYSWPKTSRRIHSVATNRSRVSGMKIVRIGMEI